jgi:histidinol phosphatase-like PHP family hydrolase
MNKIQQYCACDTVDFHIHPRPNCFDLGVLSEYANAAKMGQKTAVGFVEHGPRASATHRGLLTTVVEIERFCQQCDIVSDLYAFPIYKGIELDYFKDNSDLEFRKQLEKTSVDYKIGSVHNYGKCSVFEYLETTLRLISDYEIDILGHFHFVDDSIFLDYRCRSTFENVLATMANRNIIFEQNLAPRYILKSSLQQYIDKKIREYGLNVIIGSDSHNPGEFA